MSSLTRPAPNDPVVTGLGITSAIGQGKDAFAAALLAGRHAFAPMRRPGRQLPGHEAAATPGFLGAEIGTLAMPQTIPAGLLRTASLSGQVALATLHEAWHDAGLGAMPGEAVGLIVGGSNVQQREATLLRDGYRGREAFVRPTYGMAFMDSDLCGLCTEAFGIKGLAHTVGGASASGQLAVIEALHAVQSGRVQACIALGALMDLSYWECQGLRSLGAMGSDRHADAPALACRPFDADRDGFIFGELCGAVVVETLASAQRRARPPYARVAGWGLGMDANRNPNPSADGETAAIGAALAQAGLAPAQIDYLNPHGTGSAIGDVTEIETLRRCGLERAWLNATKSITGHGLSAAGTAELIAVLLQMQAGTLHPTRNLDRPIDPALRWVGREPVVHPIRNALNLSMGFGGINTAVCLQRYG
ncbi:polyketide beta-ketoacyl:ACP synthase [Chitiniphilus purpureus]|uniref:Polyketide beta-ketoacyl:ACP synthase n=1 Tax=Chitiniphilus purpureus TaxID=2981137 RepID=A0ABY6DR51_9NEIS|nr:beta-ketoacyl synthase N-terminal-like domain-containing protein [Chitiniphilus sp. CD1]UXY16193.1 polyketide beta-ketoacyl:ACP synthase [Chitiniphilus sp. CD1]